MVKDTQTIRGQQPTNYLSVFDHFVGLALKGLTKYNAMKRLILNEPRQKYQIQQKRYYSNV